jgi:Flp pilus assembly pilin Flp
MDNAKSLSLAIVSAIGALGSTVLAAFTAVGAGMA